MDIAALSIGLSQMKLQSEVSTSVLKMAMDGGVEGMDKLMKSVESSQKAMEKSINPNIGGNIDIKL